MMQELSSTGYVIQEDIRVAECRPTWEHVQIATICVI